MESRFNQISTNNITGGGRNYSIDLLKILSMMMVVVLHLNLFGGINKCARLSDDYIFKLIVNFYEEICIIAVNTFVIISAWFLSASQSYSLKSKRIIRLIVSMFFWYVIASIIAIALGNRIEIKRVLISLPIIGCSYDFIAGYLMMYFLSPFLNKLTNSITDHSYKVLAIGLFLVFSFFAPITINGYLGVGGGYSFAWFVCIYIIVGYVRTYGFWNKYSWRLYFFLFLILSLVGTICRILLPNLYVAKGYYNDPVIFMSSLTCFLLFASLSIKRNNTKKIVKFFVPLSVAVFFIHANPFIEEWFRTVNFTMVIDGRTFLYALLVPVLAFAIYIVCTACEYLRELLFDKFGINKLLDRLAFTLDKHLDFS